MTNKIYISWNEFHQDVKKLAVQIKDLRQFNRIISISRGGLLPAGILAYELDIRNCETVNIISYNGDTPLPDSEVKIDHIPQNTDEKTLIIDDLSDTGRTFELLRKQMPQACFACVYTKPQGKDVADIYARNLPNQWIVFPWDIE